MYLVKYFSMFLALAVSPVQAVTMSDLVQRDGLFFEKFSDVPFTGSVEGKNVSGGTAFPGYVKGEIVEGVEQGTWRGYHDNGQLLFRGDLKDGKRAGEWVYYSADGTMLEKGRYKDDLRNGVWSSYYKSGQIKSKGIFDQGVQTGIWELYSKSGDLDFKGDIKVRKRLIERKSDISLKKKKREEQRKQANVKKGEEQRRAKLIEERNKKRVREELEQKKELERKLNAEKEKLADKRKLVSEDKQKDEGDSVEIKKTEAKREHKESKKRILEEERRLAEIRRQREEERRLEELERLRMIEEFRRTQEEIQDTLEAYNEDVRESEARQKKIRAADAAERAGKSELLEAELEKYVDAIRRLVRNNWSWGGDIANVGLRVEYELVLRKNGDVIDIRLVGTSGNAAYDESVKKAIEIAGSLPVPTDESFFHNTFGRGVKILFEF